MDASNFPATELQPGYRPGERMVAGRPYVFSLGLLNAYVADQKIAAGVPADLAAQSYEDLTGLLFTYLNAYARRPHDPEVRAFGDAVCGERARRPEYVAVYGRAA